MIWLDWKRSVRKADSLQMHCNIRLLCAIERFLALLIFLLINVVNTYADASGSRPQHLTLNLKLRERLELWQGMNALNYGDSRPSAPGELDDRILLQRIIAGFHYQIDRQTDLFFHLQDARAWGWSLRHSIDPSFFKIHPKDKPEPYYLMNPNEQFLEIYDAHLKHRFVGEPIEITLGRQKISFGDNRIFGPGEWGNTGRWTWDALRIQWRKNSYSLDLFAGGTKTHNPVITTLPFTQMEYTGVGFYGSIDLKKGYVIEPFYAWKGPGNAPFARERKLSMHWVGLRSTGNLTKNLTHDLTLVGQTGRKENQQLIAYAIAAKLSYQQSNLTARPELSLRWSYASGGSGNDGKLHTFDPVFGARDRYYGLMNLLSWSNLDDRECIITLRPDRSNSIELAYHWFFVPHPENQRINGTLQLDPGQHFLGSELDIQWRAKVHKDFEFTGTFGRFIPGNVKPIAGKEPRSATYLSFQILWQFEHQFINNNKN